MRRYGSSVAAVPQSDLAALSPFLLFLMLRNVATDGFVFADPFDDQLFSAPGCVIASPSFDRNQAEVRQDYVYNWTRDAAVVAMEIAAAQLPAGWASGRLNDYVAFAATCQANAPGGDLGLASWTIEGGPRQWSSQYDGPAIQTVAILAMFDQLDPDTQATARQVAQRNLDFLMPRLGDESVNLWEEVSGHSFFTRSVQLRCLSEVRANTIGLPVPPGTDAAIADLRTALDGHWNGEHYVSVLDLKVLDPGKDVSPYDPNIDIVMAAIYGAVECTDPRVLATAAALRDQWSGGQPGLTYKINLADAAAGMGPMLGRYPGDTYDGDNNDSGKDHPWALCTANFAQLYYELASAIEQGGQVPADPLAAGFFTPLGITPGSTPAADAGAQLRDAGDRMLRAVVRHSDHLELSEQFDGETGYEKSVRNLTWSYAAFLSALRARTP